jgi:hypothetical protein
VDFLVWGGGFTSHNIRHATSIPAKLLQTAPIPMVAKQTIPSSSHAWEEEIACQD